MTDINLGIRVCAVTDLRDGEAVRVPRDETGTTDDIAVFNDNGEFFAIDDTCTHAQASLSEGWVEEGQVECPLHSGIFCLRTGDVVGLPPVRGVGAHRVLVRDEQLWLLPDTEPNSPSSGVSDQDRVVEG
jgi:3-phenylpropionate/trans-cinnamate dioxygenase ferredoxin component